MLKVITKHQDSANRLASAIRRQWPEETTSTLASEVHSTIDIGSFRLNMLLLDTGISADEIISAFSIPTVRVPVTHEHACALRVVTHARLSKLRHHQLVGPMVDVHRHARFEADFDRAIETCACGQTRVVTFETTGEIWYSDWNDTGQGSGATFKPNGLGSGDNAHEVTDGKVGS